MTDFNTMRIARGFCLLAMVGLAACGTGRLPVTEAPRPVDARATTETQALFLNLDRIRHEHVLFGHQDALAYGIDWLNEPGRSDVMEVAGSYPAVYGWELGHLETGATQNLDGVNFDDMRRWIIEGYNRGGVITIGWHMNNPVGGSAWDTDRAIHTILPGGEHHAMYREWLDRFVAFNEALTREAGGPVPIIFRPFHEMTGSWFWWGRDHVTPEEYIDLWRFTVRYLRDEEGVNNLLYAYSTDRFDTEEQFLEHYPGDAYVDVMGLDDYSVWRQDDGIEVLGRRLRTLVEIAEARGKIPALTETGHETVPHPDFWTEKLLRGILHDPVGRRIAWVLVWRNANHEHDRPDHFYGPHPGHPSAPDFVRFRNDPSTLFEDDLPDMYRSYAPARR
jgi:mannan endo-1,4-beta-mannosidase